LSQGQTTSSTVRLASWFGTDDPRRERGAERTDSGTARSEYLGISGAGNPAGLPRDSGCGMQWTTTGQDEVPVREARTASVLTRSRPTESHRNRRQLCWQCSGTGHLRRESLGGRNQGAGNTNSVTRGCTGTKGGKLWFTALLFFGNALGQATVGRFLNLYQVSLRASYVQQWYSYRPVIKIWVQCTKNQYVNSHCDGLVNM
jgi:hypothetical protein